MRLVKRDGLLGPRMIVISFRRPQRRVPEDFLRDLHMFRVVLRDRSRRAIAKQMRIDRMTETGTAVSLTIRS